MQTGVGGQTCSCRSAWKTANSLRGEPAWQREALVSAPCWISPHAWPGVPGAQNQTGHSLARYLCLQASGFTWAGDHLGAPAPLFSAFDILRTAPALGSGGLSLPPWMPAGPLSGSLEFLTPTASRRAEAQSHCIPEGRGTESPVPVMGSHGALSGCKKHRWMAAQPRLEGEARPPSVPLLSSGSLHECHFCVCSAAPAPPRG